MCTTTSNGGAGGVDIGGGESQSGSCLFTKKTMAAPPKKQRVPKRGPGVAELEKILREQGDNKPELLLDRRREKGANTTNDVAVVVASPPPPPLPLPSSPPPPAASSASKTLAFAPLSNPTTQFSSSPPRTQLYSFLPQPTMWNPGESGGDVGSCSKSAFRFPFSTLLGSNGSDQQATIPSPAFVQRTQQQSCPTMMNLFPHSSPAAQSSSCHATAIEPPSNQTVFCRQFPVSWPDEDKPSLVGTKRSCPYSMDIPQIPAFRYQVIPSYLPQVTESVSAFSSVSHYRANPEPIDPISRGQSSSSYPINYEQSFRRCSSSRDPAAAEGQGSFVLFGFPTTTRIPRQQQQQHFNFNPPAPCQEMKKTMDSPTNKLPFYSFLTPEGEQEQETNRAETEFSFMTGDGLDLSLKL